jgi:hypothetical protein
MKSLPYQGLRGAASAADTIKNGNQSMNKITPFLWFNLPQRALEHAGGADDRAASSARLSSTPKNSLRVAA